MSNKNSISHKKVWQKCECSKRIFGEFNASPAKLWSDRASWLALTRGGREGAQSTPPPPYALAPLTHFPASVIDNPSSLIFVSSFSSSSSSSWRKFEEEEAEDGDGRERRRKKGLPGVRKREENGTFTPTNIKVKN